MELHEEIEVDLTDRKSSDSISGVPIKKRLFCSLQCSSSPPQETCLMPQNCRGQPTKFLLEAESSVSDNGAGLALDTNIRPKVFQRTSSILSGQRSYLCGDLNMSLLHGSAIQANHEMVIEKATSAFKGSSMLEDLNMDNGSSLVLDMEKGKQLPQPCKSEMLVGDRIIEGKFASGDVSAFQGVATTSSWHSSSCNDKEYHGLNSSEQAKVETCSLDLPLANELDSKYGSAHPRVNRENWDLNVPMEAWHANSYDSFVEHDMDDRLKQGVMHQQKIDRCLVQTTLGTIGSDLTSGTSMVDGSQYNLRSRNLGMPTDDNRDYKGGLELQLSQPSRPELRIKWGKKAPPDLSLSLTGNLSDTSCSVVKPEPCECSSQKETETSQHSSLNSIGIRHVKFEPCDGSFQGEASKVAGSFQGEASKVAAPFDQQSSPDRVVKSEPPKELERKPPNLELGNHQLTSSCIESPQSKVKPVVLNSNAVPGVNMLRNDSPVMPGNVKVKSGESTCLALDPATVSGPNVSCKAEDVRSDICTHQHAEGSTSKSVGSVISDSKRCNAKETEIHEIADMASTLHSESVFSDLKDPTACDGMLQGSAEMDCSDGECYTSSELISGDVHLDPDKNSVPSGGNHKGMNLPAEIQKEHFNGNEQQLDASGGPSSVGNKITRLGGGNVDGEDGKLRGPVPQCADDSSCEPEEKGVHGNVATDSIGSDSVPMMTEVHLDTKDKQIVFKEARSGHSAENRDKKETSCNMSMDLHESSATRVSGASSSKNLTKPSQGATENHLGKKGLEMKSKSIEPPSASAKTSKDYVGGRQVNIRDASVSIKHLELPERDSDVSGIANKHVDDRGKYSQIKNVDDRCKLRQNKKVSSPTIRSFGQRSPISTRSVPSGSEKERLIDNPQRRDRLYPQGRRYSKFESKKNQDQQVGNYDSNYMNTRRDGNQHFDWDSDTQYAPERDNSRGYRFPRLSKGLETSFNVAPNGSVGSAGRLLRRPIDDQLHHTSRFPPRRQSPGPREGPLFPGAQSAGYPSRDVSPSRFLGREVHDNLRVPRDEEIMRSLRGEMVDNSLYSHPNLQYEPAENDLLPRGRSLSPIKRRAPPVQLYRARSPHKWPSPGRSPEILIDKHPELQRYGPPPVVRFDRLRSPHSRLCFPEDVIVRRNVSPPYMREMHPVKDFDLPRPGMAVQRNIRRFDLGPHETAEYPGPSHCTDQFVDRRDYRDRRELVQPFRPRLIPGDDDDEDILRYPPDDGCYGPINFCPDGEVFPGRGRFRDLDDHVSNRLGNTNRLVRSMEEQREGYRHHGKQGWHDGGLNDGRLKRRKL